MIGVKILKDETTVELSDGRKGELLEATKNAVIVSIDGKVSGFKRVQNKPMTDELSDHFWSEENNDFETAPVSEKQEPEKNESVSEPEPEQKSEPEKKKSKKEKSKKENEGDE